MSVGRKKKAESVEKMSPSEKSLSQTLEHEMQCYDRFPEYGNGIRFMTLQLVTLPALDENFRGCYKLLAFHQ
jgi:hypothetical protein